MGSNIEVINAPDDNTDSVNETLDCFTAPKNVIQCKEIIIPLKIATKKIVLVTIKDCFKMNNTIPKPNVPITIRYHTNEVASIEISAPNIAVKPKINTIK